MTRDITRKLAILESFQEVNTLENVYKSLKVPKPTAGYYVKQFERNGLLKTYNLEGRLKPREITPKGKLATMLLRKGIDIPGNDFEFIIEAGKNLLTKKELCEVIEVFESYLETGKVPEKYTQLFSD
jgi:hypothetical protein